MTHLEILETQHDSPEALLLFLSKRLWITSLVDRILNPTERNLIDDPRSLSSIAPLVYSIWNVTKNWIIAALARHVYDISSSRSYWEELDKVCSTLWIQKEDLSKIIVTKKTS